MPGGADPSGLCAAGHGRAGISSASRSVTTAGCQGPVAVPRRSCGSRPDGTGVWLPAVTAAVLLLASRARPGLRRPAAIACWVLLPMAIAWFILAGGSHDRPRPEGGSSVSRGRLDVGACGRTAVCARHSRPCLSAPSEPTRSTRCRAPPLVGGYPVEVVCRSCLVDQALVPGRGLRLLASASSSGVCVGQGSHAVAALGGRDQAQVRALAGAEQLVPLPAMTGLMTKFGLSTRPCSSRVWASWP